MSKSRLAIVASSFSTDGPSKQAQIDQLRLLFDAVNHDLRQPLQTVELLCGVLNAKTKDHEILKVNARIEETLHTALDMLDTFARLGQPAEQDGGTCPEHEEPARAAGRRDESAACPSVEAEKSLSPTVFIVDDDIEVREAMGDLFKSHGHPAELFESCEQFLAFDRPIRGCLIIDVRFPGMSGLTLLKKLKDRKDPLPAIMITGRGDIALAVEAMKSGAVDFIEKPINHKELLAVVTEFLQQTRDASRVLGVMEAARARLARLSGRERQVMEMVLEGRLNKNIAADLGISQRTVETHRANIMKKMGVKSLPALLRMTLAAAA
jgi:FixJ family two-component response regulator